VRLILDRQRVLSSKETLMRTALLTLSLLALPGLPLAAAAPQDPGTYPTKKVTLHLHAELRVIEANFDYLKQ
jgi:hypothetical protein